MKRLLILTLLAVSPAIADVPIPEAGDWTDHGQIIARGTVEDTDWDWRLNGSLNPGAMIRFDNTYFIYYIGASGNRGDGGPAYRKIGVATCPTSSDCTSASNWTEYGSNPIITHEIPEGCDETGVFSISAWVESATVYIIFGGMEEGVGCDGSVDCDGMVVSSSDGFSFGSQDSAYLNSEVVGSDDERMPAETIKVGSTYYSYYVSADWDLYVTTGTDLTNLTSGSEEILDLTNRINEVSVQPISETSYAVFVVDRTYPGNVFNLDVRTTTTSDPTTLSSQVDFYGESTDGWGDMAEAIVFYDSTAEVWWMVYNDDPDYGDIHIRSAGGGAQNMNGLSGGSITGGSLE